MNKKIETTVEIEEEIYQQIFKYCYENKMTMNEFAEQAFYYFIEKEQGVKNEN